MCEAAAVALRDCKQLARSNGAVVLMDAVSEASARARVASERLCPLAFDAPPSPYANTLVVHRAAMESIVTS